MGGCPRAPAGFLVAVEAAGCLREGRAKPKTQCIMGWFTIQVMRASRQNPEFQRITILTLFPKRHGVQSGLEPVLAGDISPAAHRAKEKVRTPPVVIMDFLLALGDAADAQAQHHRQVLLDKALVASVRKAGRRLFAQSAAVVGLRAGGARHHQWKGVRRLNRSQVIWSPRLEILK